MSEVKERLFLVIANGDGEDQRLVRGGVEDAIKGIVDAMWVGPFEEAIQDPYIDALVKELKELWGEYLSNPDPEPFHWHEKGEQCYFEIREIIAVDPKIKELERKLEAAKRVIEDLVLESDHSPDCESLLVGAGEDFCSCMDKKYFNIDVIRERARQYLKEIGE